MAETENTSEFELKRREVLGLALGALAFPTIGEAGPAAGAWADLLDDRSYFLSAANPVANVDQREIERVALQVMDLPVVLAARERSSAYWFSAMSPDWDEPTKAMFDSAMEEYAFNYVMKAVCSDASHPRIGQVWLPAHDGFGAAVPGSRIGGDNPDNIYRLTGIEHGASYELVGRPAAAPPNDVSYTLVSNYGTTNTVMTIQSDKMEFGADGSFKITIDGEPAGGRRNHLQTQPGTQFLFIRDTLGDWARESANRLRIRRLTPASADPLSPAQIGERAAREMFCDVPLYYWYQRVAQFPVNALPTVRRSGAQGGLVTQAGCFGGARLAPDKALIVEIAPGGAAYNSLVAHDMYYRTIDVAHRVSSYNCRQLQPNPDGSQTLVLARTDPGVRNWVDLNNLPASIVLLRWQALPDGELRASASARVAPIADLGRLAPHAQSITSAERQKQLAERTAAYQRRLTA